MSMRLDEHIDARLKSCEGIVKKVKDRIYPSDIVMGTEKYPYISYVTRCSNVEYDKDGVVGETCSVELNVVAKDREESTSLAELVRNAIELYRAKYDTFRVMGCEVDSYEHKYIFQLDAYVYTINFEIETEPIKK